MIKAGEEVALPPQGEHWDQACAPSPASPLQADTSTGKRLVWVTRIPQAAAQACLNSIKKIRSFGLTLPQAN